MKQRRSGLCWTAGTLLSRSKQLSARRQVKHLQPLKCSQGSLEGGLWKRAATLTPLLPGHGHPGGSEGVCWLTCSLRACMDLNSMCSLFFLIQSGSSGISTLKSSLTRISRCCRGTRRERRRRNRQTLTSVSSPPSLPPPKQPTAQCLCCSCHPPPTTPVTVATTAAASSWIQQRQN